MFSKKKTYNVGIEHKRENNGDKRCEQEETAKNVDNGGFSGDIKIESQQIKSSEQTIGGTRKKSKSSKKGKLEKVKAVRVPFAENDEVTVEDSNVRRRVRRSCQMKVQADSNEGSVSAKKVDNIARKGDAHLDVEDIAIDEDFKVS